MHKMMKMNEDEKFDYLVDRLLKECSNSRGYIGVEYDNFDLHEGETKSEVLFHKILDELVNLPEGGSEYIDDPYDDEEKPFDTEANLMKHVVRLQKFVRKYAPLALSKEKADAMLEQV